MRKTMEQRPWYRTVTEAIDRRTMMATVAGWGMGSAALAYASPYLAEPRGSEQGDTTSDTGPGLRARAAAKGLLCGAETNLAAWAHGPQAAAALIPDCNILVPGLELKWSRLQPTPAPPDFANAEQIYRFAAAHGMKMRGHCLTWYRAKPAWAVDMVSGMSPSAAAHMLESYVRTVVGHWRGRLVHWDVTNEPIDGNGQLTDKMWAPKLGEEYIDLAFHAAREADPGALLMVNVEAIEQDSPWQDKHRAQTLMLLERLKKRGVPVQALGIEGHLSTLWPFAEAKYRRFLDDVSALGLKLLVTELDVSDKGTLGSIAVRDAAVAALGRAFLEVTLSYPNCLGLLTWDQSDRDTWLRTSDAADKQRADGQPLRPSPLDDQYRRKPLWYAIAGAVDAAPPRSHS